MIVSSVEVCGIIVQLIAFKEGSTTADLYANLPVFQLRKRPDRNHNRNVRQQTPVDLLSDSGNTATGTNSSLYTPTASMNCRKLSNNGAQNSDPQHVSPHKRWLPSVADAAAILSPPPTPHCSVNPTAALSSSAASSSHHTTTTSTTTNIVISGTTIATNS
jgi:hypothetical protein